MTSLDPTVAFPSVDELTSAPSTPVTLKADTIDLWSCSLESSSTVLAHCHAWLSEEERARAARFVRPEDQTRFTLAHGSLRHMLAKYLGIGPSALQFLTGPTGKPGLRDQQGSVPVLHFNLSHSHGRMLVAVSEKEVGVDLEQVRTNVEPLKLAERFYTQAEYHSIKSRPVSDQALEFYRLWVAKEAVLKAQGIGIPSLQQCEIAVSGPASRAGVRVPHGSAVREGWSIQWLRCGQTWQGAVSAHGHEWSVRVLDHMNV